MQLAVRVVESGDGGVPPMSHNADRQFVWHLFCGWEGRFLTDDTR